MTCTKHISQLSYLLRIGNRLIKRLCKVMAYKNGQVGVLTLQVFEAVSVYNSQVIVVVLLCYKSARILTESTHFILPRLRIPNEFSFVKYLVDHLHDLVAALDTDTDINGPRLMGNSILLADFFQPVSASSSGSNNDIVSVDFLTACLIFQTNALTDILFENNIVTLRVKTHLHAFFLQIILDIQIQLLSFLRSQMTDRAVYQLKACTDGTFTDFFDLLALIYAFHMLVSAKLQIDRICIINEFLRKFRTDQIRQFSSYLAGKA